MSLQVQCPNERCATTFERPLSDTGKIVSCPSCQTPVVLPLMLGGGRAGRTLGGYKLIRFVARGGMGEIYEAIQVNLDRRVALKVLSNDLVGDEKFIQRFEREAKAAAAINHPNLVQVYDYGVEGMHVFLAMEFIEGEDLGRRIAREGRLAPPLALRIVEDIASALEAAQARGIVHRDIKPANILLTTKTQVKVSDLGLARRLDDDMDLTATGSGIGSPHFMSPEQATDAHRADHRSDIYSLGITLFFLVTGTRPFDGATAYAIVLAHANNPLPRAADLGVELPENLQRLIERMTAKRPLERYQDYRSLIADVRRVKAGHSIASAPAPDDVTLASGQGLSAGLGASELPSVPHAGPAPSAPAAASKPAQSDTRDAEPRGLRQPVLLAVTIVFAALAIVVAIVATNRPNRDGGTSKPGQPFNVEPGKGTDVSQTEPKGPPDPDGGFRPPPKGAKGLPPSPLPPLPEIRSPLADGPVAEMFAQAQAFAASNPSAFRQMLARFEQVQAKAAGSALAAQVDAAIATKKRMRDAAVESSMVEFSKRMTAEESRMGPHCVHVWSEFPEELRSEELDRRIYDLVLNTIGRVTGNDPRKGGPPPEFGPKGKESEEFPKKGKEFEDSSKKGKKGGEGGPKGKRPPDDG